MRAMHVDLDYIYDPDPMQQDKNLGALLERINAVGASAVFLQAFSDESGSGEAKSLYFPNRHLPMKADLFSRVSWQIRTRTSARQVFAWLPLLAFVPGDSNWFEANRVKALEDKSGIGYKRLSPFSSEARRYISEIYEDLAMHAHFRGILVHDDATLSDYEDVNPAALKVYSQWGLPTDIQTIRSNPATASRWATLKTAYLSDFANDLRTSAERYRKPLSLARNYYTEPVLNPEAEAWFAQSYQNGLARFDWVALMAMPYFEKVKDPDPWFARLVEVVNQSPGAKQKTIFELQAKDWNTNQFIPNKELAGWMRFLRLRGIRNIGYYPDDPFANHPNIDVIKPYFSTKSVMDR